MDTEIQNIANLLNQTFDKGAWHGPSVTETLENITEKEAFNRLPNTHSIIELVAHMTAWRTYVVKKLNGDAGFNVSPEQNFPVATDWEATRQGLQDSQRQLISALGKLSGDLSKPVPGREKPLLFYTLLHGLVHHDLYHTGQIALIKKATVVQSF